MYKIKKTVIINRAVPGSGKTSISKSIVNYLSEKSISVVVYSTDDYFVTEKGQYRFDLEKLYDNHMKNLLRFIQSLENGEQVVICDNTNLSPWQTEPYTAAARKYDYSILFISFPPRKLDEHIKSQQVSPEKPDAHGVPEEVLVRFIQEYEEYDSLLDSTTPVNPVIHKHYAWDCSEKKRIETDESCPYFDLDDVIIIYPKEYHKLKDVIGKIVYERIVTKGSI